MADRVLVDMGGLPELRQQLDGLREDVRSRLSTVLKNTASTVQTRARGFAPKDRGDLARAIEVRGGGLAYRVGLVDRVIPARGGSNSAHLNPSVYGVWYELGFVTRRIAARPFMGPAVAASELEYENAVTDALNGAIS